MANRNELTSQFTLFPNRAEHAFTVSNQLLKCCIGRGSTYGEERINGFNSGSKTLGYALLCDIASRALNFRRMPFLEDRIFADYSLRSSVNTPDSIISRITLEELESAVNELRQVYQHTQNKLAGAGLKTVRLRRNLWINRESESHCHTLGLMKLKEVAGVLGLETVSIESDTLMSFTNSDREYVADANFEMDVPIEKILYCSQLVTAADDKELLESNEWVVINDSPTGIFEIPAATIHFDFDKHFLNLSENAARAFINDHTPWGSRDFPL